MTKSYLLELFEAISDHYHNHGQYPQVEVSPSFYNQYSFDISRLMETMDVCIDEAIEGWILKNNE